jgi:tetratricopeptide (TPR) repeat protein
LEFEQVEGAVGFVALDLPMLRLRFRQLILRVLKRPGRPWGLPLGRCALALAALVWTAHAQVGGKTFALVIGIEDYKNQERLPYALNDARSFAKQLQNTGTTAAPVLLVNETATRVRILYELRRMLLLEAGPLDSVYIFISARGLADARYREGYIMTYETPSGRLAGLSLSVDELRYMIARSSAGRIVLFADVCRQRNPDPSGNIINLRMEELKSLPVVRAILASQPRQPSIPDHERRMGVFTHYLNESLTLKPHVTFREAADFLGRAVRQHTGGKQVPRVFGRADGYLTFRGTAPAGEYSVAGRTLPFVVAVADRMPRLAHLRSSLPVRSFILRATAWQTPAGPLESLQQALAARKLAGSGGALDLLRSSKDKVPSVIWNDWRDKVVVAVLEEGIDIVARYGSGHEIPGDPAQLVASDFEHCEALYGAALELNPGAENRDEWMARMLFCRGRVAVFRRDWPRATQSLRAAIDLAPALAEPYNALGIAFLETGDYRQAAAVLQEAVKREPGWAHAHHNLALAHIELVNYADARGVYETILARAGEYAYLHYSYAQLLQRLGQLKAAERAFGRAIAVLQEQSARKRTESQTARNEGLPARAEAAAVLARLLETNQANVYNALGALMDLQRKPQRAESMYLKALEIDPAFGPARYNLAVLLLRRQVPAASADLERAAELLAENVRRAPGDLLSRQKLAEVHLLQRRFEQAADGFRAVAAAHPDSIPALLSLAEAMRGAGRTDEAARELEQALERAKAAGTTLGLWDVHALLGDLYAEQNNHHQACAHFTLALEAPEGTPARARRRELQRKAKACTQI